MAIQDLTSVYRGADLEGANSGVVYLPILRDSTLTGADVLTDAAQSGAAVFEVRKNGAVIAGLSALTIPNAAKIGSIAGLNIALVKGDEIVLNLLSGNVSAPVTLNLVVDDGASSGGSGGGNLPDNYPAEPSAYDDEFDGTSLDAKWTNVTNGGSVNTIQHDGDGSVILKVQAASIGEGLNSLFENLASGGDWKFRCKISMVYLPSQYGRYFVLLRETATGKTYGMGLTINGSFQAELGIVYSPSGFPASGVSLDGSAFPVVRLLGATFYFQIKKVGTNLTYSFSVDGRSYFDVITRSVTADFASAPNQIGFGLYTYYANSMMSCDWFRRIS